MYALKADIVKLFGERELIALTDRLDTGAIDDVVLDDALANASSEIDAYVSAKVAVPLTNVSAIVKTHCCNIARYRLVGAEAQETEEIRNRYNDAVKFFRMVGEGKIQLGVDVAGAAAAGRGTVQFGSGTRTGSAGRVFDRDSTEAII